MPSVNGKQSPACPFLGWLLVSCLSTAVRMGTLGDWEEQVTLACIPPLLNRRAGVSQSPSQTFLIQKEAFAVPCLFWLERGICPVTDFLSVSTGLCEACSS